MELFSETAFGCTASYFVNIIWRSVGFVSPHYFDAVYCFIAVAEWWLLLDIEWFVLFYI